eukprot:TRINITY_DN764_c0_g1_i7.p1 TRINITY_DN764_c0_g1~~TRINITY_DN764_c0_g1_i7.p1  ORF type:complete len:208 (-),score=18.96 TRINITY_DN764_c0_g1_i7:556-1179(-)
MIEHTGRLLDEDQQLQIQVTDPDCRICRGAGSSKTPLYLPCDCQGDGNGVHLDCLSTWIQCRPAAQEAMTCEVCGAKYNLDYRRRVVFKRDQCCSTGSWRQYRDLGIMLLVFGVSQQCLDKSASVMVKPASHGQVKFGSAMDESGSGMIEPASVMRQSQPVPRSSQPVSCHCKVSMAFRCWRTRSGWCSGMETRGTSPLGCCSQCTL